MQYILLFGIKSMLTITDKNLKVIKLKFVSKLIKIYTPWLQLQVQVLEVYLLSQK